MQETSIKQNNPSLALPIITIVLAILGIFTFGLIFIPIAFICAIIATISAIKNRNSTYIGLTVLAWVFSIIGFVVSPSLSFAVLGILGGFAGASGG